MANRPAPYAVHIMRVVPEDADHVVQTFGARTEQEARTCAGKQRGWGPDCYVRIVRRENVQPWFPEPGIQDGWDFDEVEVEGG
jgi:hypothetical protein